MCIGMLHDADVGCNGREGYMSDAAGKWSSCSRETFLNHYNVMKSEEKWCLTGTK